LVTSKAAYSCQLSNTAGGSQATGTNPVFNTVEFDTASMGDVTNNCIVVPVAGIYHLNFFTYMSYAGRGVVRIQVNGSDTCTETIDTTINTVYGSVSCYRKLASGDIIKGWVDTDGGSRSLSGGGINQYPRLTVMFAGFA